MPANKTIPTEEDITTFINRFVDAPQKRLDSATLLQLMQKAYGEKPVMWGPSIIGFGEYHYTYNSGHQGAAPLIGFSPRKSAISLYVFTGLKEHEHLLTCLGKFKTGKACIYINRLSDIHLGCLETLMQTTIHYLKKQYP